MVAIDLYSDSDHKQDEEQHTHGQVSTSTSPETPPSLLIVVEFYIFQKSTMNKSW